LGESLEKLHCRLHFKLTAAERGRDMKEGERERGKKRERERDEEKD